MDMLERAAAALADGVYQLQQKVPEIDCYRHVGMGEWSNIVRAVLLAIREPSEAMIASGMKCADVDLASEYRAMIDAALAE